MAWPDRVYDATQYSLFYTFTMGAPGDPQPLWNTLDSGLPFSGIDVEIRSFALDKAETPIDTRMVCVVSTNGVADGAVYAKTTGAWGVILTTAAAKALAGLTSAYLTLWYVTVDPITGYIYALLAQGTWYNGHGIAVLRSVDHGANWTAVVVVAEIESIVSWGNIEAYNSLVVFNWTRYDYANPHTFSQYSVDDGATWSSLDLGHANGAGAVCIHPLVAGTWYCGLWYGETNLYRCTTAPGYTLLSPGGEHIGFSGGGMWFDSGDAAHMAISKAHIDYLWVETFDSWATLTVHEDVSTTYHTEIGDACQDHCFVLGAGHDHIAVSTDGYSDITAMDDSVADSPITRGLWCLFGAGNGSIPTPHVPRPAPSIYVGDVLFE